MDYDNFAAMALSACWASPRVFVLNPRFKHQNFYSQQLRCAALVQQLFASGALIAGQTLVVVGAGVAGLTTAAAALTGGAEVKLIEKEDCALQMYKDADHRELHPNIIAWPFQEPRIITNLPFLNWACGPASMVATTIEKQWKEDFEGANVRIRGTVSGIEETENGVDITLETGKHIHGHVVVLTVGADEKTTVGAFRGEKYWVKREFGPGQHVSISGTGDGGLIDAATQHFKNAIAAARTLAYLLKESAMKSELANAERRAVTFFDAGQEAEALALLKSAYERTAVSDGIRKRLRRYEAAVKKTVRLYHLDQTAFSPNAAPLNKLLVAFLMQPPMSVIEPIKITEITAGLGAPVFARLGSGTEEIDRDRFLVRHGADDCANVLLAPAQRRALEAVPQNHLTTYALDKYDPGFYRDKPAKAYAPTRRHKPQVYFARMVKQVRAMLNHLSNEALTIADEPEFLVDGRSTWVIRASDPISEEIETVFPFEGDGFTLQLDESRPRNLEAREW